jgi:hypothetical protein
MLSKKFNKMFGLFCSSNYCYPSVKKQQKSAIVIQDIVREKFNFKKYYDIDDLDFIDESDSDSESDNEEEPITVEEVIEEIEQEPQVEDDWYKKHLAQEAEKKVLAQEAKKKGFINKFNVKIQTGNITVNFD